MHDVRDANAGASILSTTQLSRTHAAAANYKQTRATVIQFSTNRSHTLFRLIKTFIIDSESKIDHAPSPKRTKTSVTTDYRTSGEKTKRRSYKSRYQPAWQNAQHQRNIKSVHSTTPITQISQAATCLLSMAS